MTDRMSRLNRLVDLIWQLTIFVGRCLKEIYLGFKCQNLPMTLCMMSGCIFALLYISDTDRLIWEYFGLEFLYPDHYLFSRIYSVLFIFTPFWLWSVVIVARKVNLSRKLTKIFINSGLQNKFGDLPSFISDIPIDSKTRKLLLTNNYLPISSFQTAKPSLESGMQVHIDDIKEENSRGIISIIYSTDPMPTQTKMPDVTNIESRQIFIGETRSRKIKNNFDHVPHLLIAGQTGGGKSTFLRQLITTLIVNQKTRDITLIDLKGGLEFQLFTNIAGVQVVPDVDAAATALVEVKEDFNARLDLIRNSGSKDIVEYNRKKKKVGESTEAMQRKFIVVDEASEIFLSSTSRPTHNAQLAREVMVKLATQGRALGIHLIIATQRPDVRAIDSQVKANLPGIISFQMANQASSMTVLGNARAKDLPSIPGRAIWRCGFEMTEVQTPFMSVEEADNLLAKFRVVETNTSKQNEAKVEQTSEQTSIPV